MHPSTLARLWVREKLGLGYLCKKHDWLLEKPGGKMEDGKQGRAVKDIGQNSGGEAEHCLEL